MRIKKRITIGIFSIVILCISISIAVAAGYQHQTLISIGWGSGSDQIGLQQGPELETVGPTTFALDAFGNIYLYDFVNQRIAKFDSSGKWVGNIGPGLICSSFCVDDSGNLYLLDVDQHLVRVYSGKGEFNREIKIDKSIELIEGYAQKIYIDAAQNLIANRVDQQMHAIENLGLQNSDFGIKNPQSSIRNLKSELGYLGKSDKNRYRMQWKNKHQAEIIVSEGVSNLAAATIPIESADELGAVLYLGQDTAGNNYAEIERTDLPSKALVSEGANDILHLEVWKYNPPKGRKTSNSSSEISPMADSARKLVDTLEVPNDYFSTVYKKLEVDDAGNIYQMQTKPEGVKVIKYTP